MYIYKFVSLLFSSVMVKHTRITNKEKMPLLSLSHLPPSPTKKKAMEFSFCLHAKKTEEKKS